VRVAIDATSVPPKPAGAGVYAIELVRAMMKRDAHDGYAVFTRGSWFDGPASERRNWRVERVGAASRQARLFWEQTRLPGALSRLGIDVLHSTHHTLPLRPVRTKRVVTIHDVTFFRIPDRYPPARRAYMQTMTRLSARVADAIIVPSEAARDDVVRLLRVDPTKVTVVYEAAAERYRPASSDECARVRARYGVAAPFVLSVGTLEPGKNRSRLIRAMHELWSEGLTHKLLIAGQPGWRHDNEETLVEELQIPHDRVIFAGYVPDDDLPAIYTACDAFAFPSLYEGFGLPVLEAMACGAPVVTSDVSATAAVAGTAAAGGPAAVLVDPHSVASIRDGLRRVLTDDALRRHLKSFGRARAAQFSWRRAADETFAVYERVMVQ
jgi:glycosyltransferase involved in cell wall biosynthesis